MSSWPEVQIGEVAKVFDGPHATPKTVDAGPIFLGIGALQNGRINLGETRHVTTDDFKIWTRRVTPQPGDVVFSYETRIGEAGIIPQGLKCCLGRRMALVRADRERLDPKFFLYTYLSPSFQRLLRSKTITGATVDRIALTDFPSFPIPLPAISEQRAIASILDALDEKIDLNRKMNETLEAIASAVFKDWFVDFGPTRAKMDGRAPYLSPELWNLFPERLDDEGVPESWTRRPLIDLCQLKRGYDLPSGLRTEGHYPIVSSSGVSGYHAKAMADPPGVVTGRYGTIGQVFFVERAFWPLNTALYVKDFKDSNRRFVFHTLSGLDFQQFSDKGAVPGINRNDLHQSPVLIPSVHIQGVFEEVLLPVWKRATLNESEADTLAQTRDLLLPKLMSGELRVRHAECVVEEVL